MRTLGIRLISAGAALALIVGMAGVAQASAPNVVTAIKAQDKVIQRSPGWKELQHFKKVTTRAQTKKFIADLGKLAKTASRAVNVVSKASTSSARQRQGKADWVKGSREQTRGIRQLRTALKDALAGKKAAAKKELHTALKTILAGTTLGMKGDKLLGLPTSD